MLRYLQRRVKCPEYLCTNRFKYSRGLLPPDTTASLRRQLRFTSDLTFHYTFMYKFVLNCLEGESTGNCNVCCKTCASKSVVRNVGERERGPGVGWSVEGSYSQSIVSQLV